MQPSVSIICPVYHSEATLCDCLNSIVNQTFKNWECIIVLDGANVESTNIAYTYKRKDSRFKIIFEDNQGRSAARNKGIIDAQGMWTTFVDSDDELLSTYLENMISVAHKYNSDIIYGNYIKKSYNQNSSSNECGYINLFTAQKANLNFANTDVHLERFCFDNFNCRTCWGKLYLTELLHRYHIKFPEGVRIGEDAIFNYIFLSYAKTVSFTNQRDYIYNDLNYGTVRKFSKLDFISINKASKLFKSFSEKDSTFSSDLKICLALDFLGIFYRACMFSNKYMIKSICSSAQNSCDNFIRTSLKEYIENDDSNLMSKCYHRLYVNLLINNLWYIAFIINRIRYKLSNLTSSL